MHRTLSDTERNLIIVTAPSGAGKTSLIKNVLKYSKENNKKVFLSVSHTTRQPRKGEQHGIDYIFIGESEFRENVNDKSYIEYATVHGNLYGTPKTLIDDKILAGYKVLLEIDWQGALEVLDKYKKATSIFISPPSIKELEERLIKRGLDSEEVIKKRIEAAAFEIEKSSKFQHQITNISLDKATKNLLNIIFRENNG